MSFSSEESKHITKVCRIRQGEKIHATDGEGHLYKIKIDSCDESKIEGVIERIETVEPPETCCHLAIPLTSGQKADWVVEKCTELGVSEFHFFVSDKSKGKLVRKNRVERFNRLTVAAIKQSMRTVLPKLNIHDDLKSLMKIFSLYDLVLFGHLDHRTESIQDILLSREFKSVLVLIGPEAGFTEEELNLLKNAGAVAVRYGDHRLRMETAAVALSTIALLFSRK